MVSYAGALPDGQTPPNPPPESWVALGENQIVIWTIKMAPGATWTLPATDPGCTPRLFYFRGAQANVAGQNVLVGNAIALSAGVDISLSNKSEESEFLLFQGSSIGEPVAQYGPFVMNNWDELRQVVEDYQRTAFGGWPWSDHAPAHPRQSTRFARYPDGHTITPIDVA